jgi:hypothetical protein
VVEGASHNPSPAPIRLPREGGDPDLFAQPEINTLDPRLRGEDGGGYAVQAGPSMGSAWMKMYEAPAHPPIRLPREGGDPDLFAQPEINTLDPRLRGEDESVGACRLTNNRPNTR